ncbi:LITAF-like zinc ribbon domain-containing protein [Gigaspora rosea]|uniref:LITAF-like zinc ribbon domain-containing protein n=1 Tax=Gigaspora rosea TaxID=44941 RepID=A0A397VD24_9GLOM|nr:LITAF-like zinc ribbon domain-containing protein [Gigaspora rosea]
MTNKKDNIVSSSSDPVDSPPPYTPLPSQSRGAVPNETTRLYPDVPKNSYSATPPPTYNPPQQSSSVTAHYQPDTVVLSPAVSIYDLRSHPAVTCYPHCNQIVLTKTNFKIGTANLLSSLGLFIIGVTMWGCCLIPLCITDLKDCIHSCPHCDRIMARYSRFDGRVFKIGE